MSQNILYHKHIKDLITQEIYNPVYSSKRINCRVTIPSVASSIITHINEFKEKYLKTCWNIKKALKKNNLIITNISCREDQRITSFSNLEKNTNPITKQKKGISAQHKKSKSKEYPSVSIK